MKKILIVSTVSRQFYLFERGNISVLHSLGYEVHAAANYEDADERLGSLGIIRHPFEIQRTPFSIKNLKAYRQLVKIMEDGNFDAVHCHSPMGGVLARLAAKKVKIKTVIYTAHGFHFYKGAPILNWLLYYPIEKICSYFTDVLITINHEDYTLAKKKMKAKNIYYIPGVGLDTNKFKDIFVGKDKIREDIGIPKDAIMLLSVGELNKNKNHEVIIRAMAKINNPALHYCIAGQGYLADYLSGLAKQYHLSDRVHLLGYRSDIPELCKSADIFCHPSKREGLPVALMEAMASGLPCVVSKIRGNVDLIEKDKGGFLADSLDVDGFKECIEKLITHKDLITKFGLFNNIYVRNFSVEWVNKNMLKIYEEE